MDGSCVHQIWYPSPSACEEDRSQVHPSPEIYPSASPSRKRLHQVHREGWRFYTKNVVLYHIFPRFRGPQRTHYIKRLTQTLTSETTTHRGSSWSGSITREPTRDRRIFFTTTKALHRMTQRSLRHPLRPILLCRLHPRSTVQPSTSLPPSSTSSPSPGSDEDEEMSDLYLPPLIAPATSLLIPSVHFSYSFEPVLTF